MKIKLAAVVTGMFLVLTAAPAYAHHPFAAEFDWKKPVTLTGKVTKFEFTNPHSFLYLDGKDENGAQVNWRLEMGNPKALASAGWNKNTVKSGDEITVDAWLSKASRGSGSVKAVRLSSGRELAGGSFILDTEKTKTKTAAN